MNGGILGKLLTNTADEVVSGVTKKADDSVLGGLLNYRSLNKETKAALNHRLYEEDPMLFHDDFEGAMLGEGGSKDIPRLHVDDLKHYFGNLSSDIPARYKRTTGKRDIDELAAMAGYDDIDQYVESIQGELSSRAQQRANKQLLSERRNDPEFIKETKKILDEEKAYYGTPDPEVPVYEPTKRDLQWYLKNVAIPKSKVTQIEVKTPPKTGMENFKINRNDVSPTVTKPEIDYKPQLERIMVNGKLPQLASDLPEENVKQIREISKTLPKPKQIRDMTDEQVRAAIPGWRSSLAKIAALQAVAGSTD